jgi:diguanylate cyclase (GGDEF)-like protein
MELIVSGLPSTVALAAVALIAYIFGRRGAKKLEQQRSEIRRQLKKAKAVVRDLEQVARQVHRNLATHRASMLGFKSRLAELGQSADDDVFRQLCQEAEKMLRPTMRLATQIAHAYDELRHQTTHLMAFTEIRTDPLTGLGNRRTLDETLKHTFAVRSRYRTPFSLAIFDIDRFKAVNDEHGHLHGDYILRLVARAIDECVRESDTVVRYGGEEFVVVLPEIALTEARLFADRVRSAVDQSPDIPVTLSAGVAEAQNEDTDRTLLTRADSALYTAKAAGRNCVFQHTGQRILPIEPAGTSESRTPADDEGDVPRAIDQPAEGAPQLPVVTGSETPLLPGTILSSPPEDAAC